MSWNRSEFDTADGTLLLLRRLASSPLVRKTLPNTAAIMQQYLGFKRKPAENMATFLVRETLGYEEFAEALMRLWEEQAGIDPAASDFGLPSSVKADKWSEWYGYDSWSYEDYDQPTTTPDLPPDPDLRQDRADETETAEQEGGQASPGSAPSGRRRDPAAPSVMSAEAQTGGITELALADSFIMQVLRGWRLLQAASLSPEETRDILSTTQNKMSFETISQALQTLWDEQLLGHRYRPWHGHLNLHEWDNAWQDDDPWHSEEHYDDLYDYYQDWSWHESEEWPIEEEPPESNPVEDEKLKEAYQAEKVAEQLALEAKRNWAEAQRTTQQMKRDRGFGHVALASSVKCFNCGGNHFARDCPDRRHPPYPGGKGSSKGKFAHHLDYGNAMFQAKGKGKKGKSKGKQANWSEWPEVMWMSGKGKGKGKPSSERPAVNVYNMDYDFAGLEMDSMSGLKSSTTLPATSEGLSSTQPATLEKSEGMLDCGATASAAPDIAVQGLIKAVLSQDSGARIDVEYMRPFFRFGNGKWGQALYKVKISSWVSGQQLCFSLFSLPNPEVMHEKNLVPILVGMDHLGIHGCQMLVDFGTGLVMDGVDTSRQTYQLRINSKGHLVYDILYNLTRGHANHEGHATIHVASTASEKEITVLQFQPLEFYVSEQSSVGTLVGTLDERRMLLQRLYDASRGTSLAQMQAYRHLRMWHPFLFVINFAMAPKAQANPVEKDLMDLLDEMTKKPSNKTSAPPDKDRAVGMDPRDPRAQRSWPCFNHHVAGSWQSNLHGMWNHCNVCNLRLSYVPRVGAQAATMQMCHPETVSRAMEELQPMCSKPTAKIVRAMMNKITADIVLEKELLEANGSAGTVTLSKSNAKAKAKDDAMPSKTYSSPPTSTHS